MKNIILFLLLTGVFVSCQKTNREESAETQAKDPEICTFGITEFNLSKRPPLEEEFANKPPRGNNGNGNGSGGGTGGGTTSNAGVLLLDFDGQFTSSPGWGTINCAPANLSSSAIGTIMNRVSNDYSPFNMIVTTDESVYNAANPYKRMRVIVTETWEWFGQAGGVSYIGSFTWGNNTPCFVFSSLLNYNEKNIGEAISHEAGHTLGLQHQASYNGTTIVSQYNSGYGSGEIGWAPIMGVGYYQNLTLWHNGPTPSGYNAYQDDATIITNVTGAALDDHSNSTTGATALNASLNGTVNSTSDLDFFSVNISSSKTLSVVPFNVGIPNAGANVDIVANIYNGQGQLIASVNDPNTLNATTSLSAGQYYISVASTPNAYASIYGMRGRYTISLF
jgi:hypothetical protein